MSTINTVIVDDLAVIEPHQTQLENLTENFDMRAGACCFLAGIVVGYFFSSLVFILKKTG